MYEYFKNKFVESHHHHLKVSEAILVGTIAAISGEIISYPLDVIKTKIQTSEKGTFRSMSSFPN